MSVERTDVALCSGGMDSTVAAHAAMQWGPAEIVVYLDTGTGLDENRDYVEDLCEEMGWHLWTLRTSESYEDWVKDQGFPGPGLHNIAYRKLKERQIDKLYSIAEGELHLWTGIRAFESDARMASAAPVEDDPRRKHRYWHNPIHDWSKGQCEDYLETFDLPRNPLWSTLGRSGDCFCGCFGSPEEKLDLRAAGCEGHAEWLEHLETEVETGDEKGRWAWGAMSHAEQRAERVDDAQMTLCSTCGASYPTATDGGSEKA